ncbi:MAG: GNVR domain-containing protein [Vicinamibacterales bacterium]
MLPGKEYTLGDYLRMGKRHRVAILLCAIAGAYIALIVSSQLKETFQSEMLIQIVPQRVPDEYVRSSVRMRTEERLLSLSQQVESRTELERLIDEMDLYPAERAERPLADVIQQMREAIEVEPAETGADVFYVRFSYSDAETATRVTERLGSLFINTNAQDRGDLAQATNDFLQVQLEESRVKLEEQERRLEAFRQRNAGRLPTQLDFNMQAMSRTQMELQTRNEAVARDRDRKLMLDRLREEVERDDQPLVRGPEAETDAVAPLVGTPAEQLVTARANLVRLKRRLTAEHPDVIRTERTIRELEGRVAAEAKSRPASPEVEPLVLSPAQAARRERLKALTAEIEALDRDIRAGEAEAERLRATLQEFQGRIEQVPGLETEWIALTRDYDTQQEAYKTLLAKSEEAQVAADLERRQIGEQFRILDPARPPVRPTGVERARINGIGLVAGLAVGLLFAAVREIRDRTFRSSADVTDILNLPVLALIPYVATDADRRRAWLRRISVSVAATACVLLCSYVFWAMELWRYVA